MRKITIAVDGYSSCGKSTISKTLARTLGYIYVDTGAMYRSIALYALRNGFVKEDGGVEKDALIAVLKNIIVGFSSDGSAMLNGENVESEIRGMKVSNCVSYVSAIPEVRHHLVELQRIMGRNGGVVMDGRDIGTVVFPNAELKLFVTADAAIRAQRRYDELKANGQPANYDEILENVKKRDYLDETRVESPLRKADDAIVLDNGNMTISEQNAWVMEKVMDICQNLE
ncbi:MAG: (d)CMP kinase [Paludibacteraceae bacterium]|nr:(d)CMP kinase [Paludibacteraceae bacterium]